jgi:hypothetical protein
MRAEQCVWEEKKVKKEKKETKLKWSAVRIRPLFKSFLILKTVGVGFLRRKVLFLGRQLRASF